MTEANEHLRKGLDHAPDKDCVEALSVAYCRQESGHPGVRVAVQDVIWPFAPPKYRIGDLFIVDENVYFVTYGIFAGGDDMMNYLMFGLVGGVIVHGLQKRDVLRDAKAKAKTLRERSYGLSVGERTEECADSIIIDSPQAAVYDVQSSRLTFTTPAGEASMFLVPPLAEDAQAILAEFPTGRSSVYPSTDPYGILIEVPSPRQLALALSREPMSSSVLEVVASNELYLASFFYQVRKMQQGDRRALVSNLPSMPNHFRHGLAEVVARTRAGESSVWARQFLVTGGFTLMFLLGSLVLLFDGNRLFGGVTLIIGLFFLVFFLGGRFLAHEQQAAVRQVANALQSEPRV
ncbi:MAG: hypothetical protein WC901_04655 [Candidatus Margulisiibacteriota bacterium]